MKQQYDKNGAGAPALHIAGEMTVHRANELRQVLWDALEQSIELEIDLSAVTALDTAGVQLLILAKQTAQDKLQQLRLTEHSPVVLEVFELLNLAGYFGDPLNLPPSIA